MGIETLREEYGVKCGIIMEGTFKRYGRCQVGKVKGKLFDEALSAATQAGISVAPAKASAVDRDATFLQTALFHAGLKSLAAPASATRRERAYPRSAISIVSFSSI